MKILHVISFLSFLFSFFRSSSFVVLLFSVFWCFIHFLHLKIHIIWWKKKSNTKKTCKNHSIEMNDCIYAYAQHDDDIVCRLSNKVHCTRAFPWPLEVVASATTPLQNNSIETQKAKTKKQQITEPIW